MKLSIDLSLLWKAVHEMGAEQVKFEISNEIKPIEPIDTELGEGFEVSLEDIDFDDGLASYQGRQVLLYIKDHGRWVGNALENGDNGNRYHVADCGKLDEMRKKGRFDRYIVTNNLDGIFPVSGEDRETGKQINGKTELKICKLCLGHLNYKGYKNTDKKKVFSSFNLTEFFDTYSSFFKFTPSGVADTEYAGYTKDWPDVSKTIKKRNNYICNLCGLDMSFHKRLLHVHHINGVKNDNSVSNLRVLCADCHRKQPYHRHLFVRHDDTVLINQLRNEQNVKVDSGWAGIYSLADPALHGVINQLEKHNAPIPEVGINVIDNRGNIVARLELGWAKKRIAIVISLKSAVTAEQQGWKVWSMRNSLTQLNSLIKNL